ncbi:haloalkane dehalogenase [Undibacterium sp.]|uniref:haloalkane dehalogenase n=1 Tax=Undibacterium sp. TaxID=1914977 RepID=UPI002731A3C9|nr:haloalkane dehalogenase [Undibacterium sp.]MDP1979412.1 haloalkane dehalogenase [Undibacterium sp.]
MSALPVVEKFLRTPEHRFAHITDFPYQPRYSEIGGLRIACIDEGPREATPILLMHGEPTWSYLYRKMIPVLLAAGFRVIAPDLVGFGRSDKPASRKDYSYLNHVSWMKAWLVANDLRGLTLFCQDWGSLIGLRMAAEEPERFERIVLANGALPTGTMAVPKAFKIWRAFSRYSPWFPIGRIVKSGCVHGLSKAEIAAYDAPFPGRAYRIAARLFPGFVPTTPDDPERQRNEHAWEVFKRWDKPFLTLFSNRDPVTRGGYKAWQELVPGAQGQPHAITRNAGHFLQEDKGEEVAAAIVRFVRETGGGTHDAATVAHASQPTL